MDVTFFNPATPFAIRDRLFKKDGMKRLNEVLGKWTGGKTTQLIHLNVCDFVSWCLFSTRFSA